MNPTSIFRGYRTESAPVFGGSSKSCRSAEPTEMRKRFGFADEMGMSTSFGRPDVRNLPLDVPPGSAGKNAEEIVAVVRERRERAVRSAQFAP